MLRKTFILALCALLALPALAQSQGTTPAPSRSGEAYRLTGPNPMPEVVPAPPIPPEVVDDKRKMRNYPDQPPVIPHSIANYQIDLRTNKCLSCHSRTFTEATQAPMISIPHYQDRNGTTLAQVSARRYFCTACHVPQSTAAPLVENTFTDMDKLTAKPATAQPEKKGR